MTDKVVARCPYCKKQTIPHCFRLPRLQFCGDLNCMLTSCIGCDRTFMVKDEQTIRSWVMERMPMELKAYVKDPPRPKRKGRPLFGPSPDSPTESL
jgi:hypothetical protein